MKKREMTTNEVVDLLLSKEREITNKFHHAVTEVMRLGYDTERGKAQVNDLQDTIEYSMEDLFRILSR